MVIRKRGGKDVRGQEYDSEEKQGNTDLVVRDAPGYTVDIGKTVQKKKGQGKQQGKSGR